MWVVVLACANPPSPATTEALEWTVEVTTPNPAAPLVRKLVVQANAPVVLDVSWTSEAHTVTVAFDEARAEHEHLLLGWRAGRTYELLVQATADDGRVATAAHTVVTDPLADHFARVEHIAGAGVREPGDTLVPMHTFLPQVEPQDLIVVLDPQGEPVYTLDTSDFLFDVQEYADGLLALVGEGDNRLVHYAWDGEVLASWGISKAGGGEIRIPSALALNLQHDAGASNVPGRFLALGRASAVLDNYPASYTDPLARATRTVALESILEFDTTGTVLSEVAFLNLLPLERIGYDSLGTTFEGWADWVHSNAVLEDADGNWIVSLRNQDAIIKVDRETHELMWILANEANWPPSWAAKRLEAVGPLAWPYHMHGPELLPPTAAGELQIVLFDNGNYRASPFTSEEPDPTPRSRVVQYAIDEQAMEVREVWSFFTPSGGALSSSAAGNATPLPGGHVLSTWGFLDALPDGTKNTAAGLGERSVRLVEIDPKSGAEVEQLYLYTEASANAKGWTGYRSARISTLGGRIVD